MSKLDGSGRLLLAGWLILLVTAALVGLGAGGENIPPAVVIGVIAVGMGMWLWLRDGRAVRTVSLVLGVLMALAFGAFVVSGLGDDSVEGLVKTADAVALIAAVCIVVGAVGGLRSRQTSANA